MTTLSDKSERTVSADAEDSAGAMAEDIEPSAEGETTQEESEAAEVGAASDAEADTTRKWRRIVWRGVLGARWRRLALPNRRTRAATPTHWRGTPRLRQA